jgi:hypothetical protein
LPYCVTKGFGSRIEVAAYDRGAIRLEGGVASNPFDDRFDLRDPRAARPEIEVQVDQIDRPPIDFKASFHEPFLADRLFAEGENRAIGYRISGKKGVAVSERLSTVARIVNSVFRIRISRFVLDVLEQIDVFVPVRGLIDFLERYDIRLVAIYESGDLLEILPDAIGVVKPLVERETSSVSDIEGYEAEGRLLS